MCGVCVFGKCGLCGLCGVTFDSLRVVWITGDGIQWGMYGSDVVCVTFV